MSSVDTFLEGALQAISGLRTCWLVTRDSAGLPSARPMGRLPFEPDSFDWTFRFLIDRRTAKARDVSADARAAIVFQQGEQAFVAVQGEARIIGKPTEVATRWQPGYDVYFPRGAGRENAAFIEVDASSLQLWIKGVTPEPFGMRTTELRRGEDRAWRVVS